MNKKMLVAITMFVVLSVVVLGVSLVSAQGGDSLTFNTSWVFQNLGPSTANVQIQVYSKDGTGAPVASDTFTVTKAKSFYAPTYPVIPANFNGSIIASSDQPLASIANQVAQNNTTGRTAYATYKGATTDSVANTMYAPVVMNNYAGYYTEMSIQNTGSSDNNVTVFYYDATGAEVTGARQTGTIKAGQSWRVAQSVTSLPAGFIGAAKIVSTSSIPLAVVVNEFVGTTGAMYNQFYSYEGFAAGSNKLTMPATFINGYGSFNASASVQNLGAAPAKVTWYFYDSGVTSSYVYSYTETITTSKSVYFPNAPYAATLVNASAVDAGWVGSVILDSNQPLVAVVNELSGALLAASYTGLPSGASLGATDIFFPLAFVNAYGFANTSFAIADVSGTGGPVNVTVSYLADKDQCPTCGDANFTYDFTTSNSQYQPTHLAGNTALGTGGVYIGSIKVHVNTVGKKIDGIMNEVVNVNGDGFTSFNSFK
jgi:hypothetical protein